MKKLILFMIVIMFLSNLVYCDDISYETIKRAEGGDGSLPLGDDGGKKELLFSSLKKYRQRFASYKKKIANQAASKSIIDRSVIEFNAFETWIGQLQFSDLDYIYEEVRKEANRIEVLISKYSQLKPTKKTIVNKINTYKLRLENEKQFEEIILSLNAKEPTQLADIYLSDLAKSAGTVFKGYNFTPYFWKYKYPTSNLSEIIVTHMVPIIANTKYGVGGQGLIRVNLNRDKGTWEVKSHSSDLKYKPSELTKKDREILDSPSFISSGDIVHWTAEFTTWRNSTRHPKGFFQNVVGVKNTFSCRLSKGELKTKRLAYGGMTDVLFDNSAVLMVKDIGINRGDNGFDEVYIISYFYIKSHRYSNDPYLDNGYEVAAIFYIPVISEYSDEFALKIQGQQSVKIKWYAVDNEVISEPAGDVDSWLFHASVYWYSIEGEESYTSETGTSKLWNYIK